MASPHGTESTQRRKILPVIPLALSKAKTKTPAPANAPPATLTNGVEKVASNGEVAPPLANGEVAPPLANGEKVAPANAPLTNGEKVASTSMTDVPTPSLSSRSAPVGASSVHSLQQDPLALARDSTASSPLPTSSIVHDAHGLQPMPGLQRPQPPFHMPGLQPPFHMPASYMPPFPFADPAMHDAPAMHDPPAMHDNMPDHAYHAHHAQAHAEEMAHADEMAHANSADMLRAYISSFIANPDLSDCELVITDSTASEPYIFSGHVVVLARSMTLARMIREAKLTRPEGFIRIIIALQGPHLSQITFLDALRFLYGAPLLHAGYYRPAHGHSLRFNTALQHIATGIWLEMPPIAHRGLEAAGCMLQWDTLSDALTFALDGGLGHHWSVEDGSDDRVSSPSSDDSLARDSLAAPRYDPFATDLLHRIIHFLITMLPPSFHLVTWADELPLCARLPLIPTNRPAPPDPRLAHIRFGDLPPSDLYWPAPDTLTASRLLLTFPFPLLKCLLEAPALSSRLGTPALAALARHVVAEREARRLAALRTRDAGRLSPGAPTHNLFWAERVQLAPASPLGFRLARAKQEVFTPPSSASPREGAAVTQ